MQAIRQGLIAQIAAEAMMDRKARLSLLEDDIARIEEIFSTQLEELTVDQVVKLTDQKRKTLEAIAKERSEWMQEEKPVYENPAMLAMQEAQRRLLAVNVEPVVEGEVREIDDSSALGRRLDEQAANVWTGTLSLPPEELSDA